MPDKTWKIKPQVPTLLIEKLSQPKMMAQLLYNRGIEDPESADRFFNPAYEKLYDPFCFKDMETAVARIWQAIKKNEKILIYGDYDADGVTSAAVLYKTFQALGKNVDVYIPHRENDGYGLNKKCVQKFIEQGYDLLITVDCGISNFQEVTMLQDAGTDVIVTDHHESPAKLPPAVAILDPKVAGSGYPFYDLAGAGVAFKLAQGLLRRLGPSTNARDDMNEYGGIVGFEKWLLDIVAVGTIADMMLLIDENRILVKWGLVVLQKTRNPGLRKMLEISNVKNITAQTIGFQIAPRLNAAGRMGCAQIALDLLIEEDLRKAEQLARELHQHNLDRQKLTQACLTISRQQIQQEQNVYFVYDEQFNPGLVGLIAGRLCDELSRPVMVMTKSQGKIMGSGRSVAGYNIVQGLTASNEFLEKFGGHTAACGFTLKSLNVLEQFKIRITQHVEKEFEKIEPQIFLDIDAKINFEEVNFEVLKQVAQFEPFGIGNSKPRFLLENLEVSYYEQVGQDKRHLRMMLRADTGQIFKMMWFAYSKEKLSELAVNDMIDVVCEMGINEWNGNQEREFKIIDLMIN